MKAGRRRALFALKAIVSVALLGWVVHTALSRDGIDVLAARLGALDPLWIVAAVALQLVSVGAGVVRWRALLRAQAVFAGARTSQGGSVLVRVADHAALGEVGGVARVDDGARGAVAVARIGRTCFVAYQLDPHGLRELPVEVDATGASLRVQCAVRS